MASAALFGLYRRVAAECSVLLIDSGAVSLAPARIGKLAPRRTDDDGQVRHVHLVAGIVDWNLAPEREQHLGRTSGARATLIQSIHPFLHVIDQFVGGLLRIWADVSTLSLHSLHSLRTLCMAPHHHTYRVLPGGSRKTQSPATVPEAPAATEARHLQLRVYCNPSGRSRSFHHLRGIPSRVSE